MPVDDFVAKTSSSARDAADLLVDGVIFQLEGFATDESERDALLEYVLENIVEQVECRFPCRKKADAA